MHKLKSPLFIVFCIVFVDVLGIGILIPVIPLLLTDPEYPYHLTGITIDQGYVLLGLLTAIYPLMQFVATPLLGQLSDRIGRKPVLAVSLLGTSLSYVVFAIAIITKNIPLLFLSRAVDGITGGNISVAQAAIADTTPPEKRARNFGIIGAAFGIGFVVGPFLGGKLSDPSVVSWFDAATPFWFAAILAFLNMLAVLFLFKETLKEKTHEAFHFLQSIINIGKAFTMPKLKKLFSVSFLFHSGFTFYTSFFGAYLIYRFAFTQGNIGDYFAFVGICIALTQAVVTGFVGKRFSPYAIISVALLGVAATVLSFTLVGSTWMLYTITLPQAVCMGLIMANLNGLISRSGDPKRQGEVLGISASVQALAQTIPPVIGGFLAAAFVPAAPIVAGSILIFCAFLVFVFLLRDTAHSISGHGDHAV
ncbi:MAG: MFS transporter, DHA1 family, tetracycline resistance protein [Parcubacteria bacterium C7867-004]|nr:MAG: MFS transporter, DHA1 family, tetracycline resistance protein [Parcubacteria bacterium C7867-004]